MSEATRTRHVLPGLRPEPLASYLAGLGLIRLLGEQADSDATAAWSDDSLVITTTVPDIAAWLTDQYVPTPVLSPWNNGSGFGPKDVEPKRRLARLLSDPSPRLARFHDAIGVAERVAQAQREGGWDKSRAVQEFRNRCPDSLLPWIDATVVLAGEQAVFPPLLGTGGNDGRLDFSTNFHELLLDVLDTTLKGRARSLVRARDLLAGTEGERLADAPVGQFDPRSAGGQSSSPFGAAASLVNPWEYVLLVEGALLFASGTARRHQHDAVRAARPFTVSFSPDGSASGAAEEESRGEVWVPVWAKAYTLAEIRQLFGEARASWHGRPAQQAVEFYAATRTLGVARGVEQFVRYGLHQRNGLAFVAVSLDRVQVRERPEVRLAAQIERWASRVRGADASSAVGRALRHFDTAYLEYARDGGPIRLRDLLAALTMLEHTVGRSGRAREKVPVRTPPPAQGFLEEMAKAECPELRVAVGIASCATKPGTDPARSPARTMRQILLPIDSHTPGRDWTKDWRDTPLVAGFGLRPIEQVLADVLAWRSRTATDEQGATAFHGMPTFRRGVPVPAADLHAFADGLLDEAALGAWLRALLALDWRGVHHRWAVSGPVTPVPTLGLLHPLALGLAPRGAKGDTPSVALSPDWANRLAAGQVRRVHEEAVARFRQAGWDAVPPPPAPAAEELLDGALLAAALVPRCLRNDAAAVMRMLTTPLRDQRDGDGQQEMPADASFAEGKPPNPWPASRRHRSDPELHRIPQSTQELP